MAIDMSSNEREVVNIMPNIFTIDYHSPQCIFFLQIPTGDLKQILLQRSLQKKKMEVRKLLEENTYTHKPNNQPTKQKNPTYLGKFWILFGSFLSPFKWPENPRQDVNWNFIDGANVRES